MRERQPPRPRTGIMLAYPYSEKRLLKYPKPWIVQPKLNGDRCRAIFDDEMGWQLVSSTALPKEFLHIQIDLNDIIPSSIREIDGELYIHGLPHEELRSMISPTRNKHENVDQLQFHIFDTVDTHVPQFDRVRWMVDLETTDAIRIVDTHYVSEIEQVEELYSRYLSEGYEGIIIRDPNATYKRKRNTQMMKLKPRDELQAVVTGMVEELDVHTKKPKGSLGAVRCTCDNITFFEVGSGFTREERLKFWHQPDLIIGQIIEFAYSEISPYGVPKMTSFKRLRRVYE